MVSESVGVYPFTSSTLSHHLSSLITQLPTLITQLSFPAFPHLSLPHTFSQSRNNPPIPSTRSPQVRTQATPSSLFYSYCFSLLSATPSHFSLAYFLSLCFVSFTLSPLTQTPSSFHSLSLLSHKHHLLFLYFSTHAEGGEDLEGGVKFLYPLHRSVQARMAIVMTTSPYTPTEAELKVEHGYHGDEDGDDDWMH